MISSLRVPKLNEHAFHSEELAPLKSAEGAKDYAAEKAYSLISSLRAPKLIEQAFHSEELAAKKRRRRKGLCIGIGILPDFKFTRSK